MTSARESGTRYIVSGNACKERKIKGFMEN